MKIIDEFSTLDLILEGMSIARFGDGEIKLCLMKDCVSQIAVPALATELKSILTHGNDVERHCLVGVPNVTPKLSEFWDKLMARPANLALFNKDGNYASSFITRPDNAPLIDVPAYWDKIPDLWRDKDMTLVRGSDRSLAPVLMPEVKSIIEVWGPRRDAYADIDRLEAETIAVGNKTVVLALGATATCLAWRLAAKGFHAMDLGHLGMMFGGKGKWYENYCKRFS
jgi:hypothetical protein